MSTQPHKPVEELFPTYNRTTGLAICAVLTTTISLLFGILNLVGYSAIEETKLTFSPDQCTLDSCELVASLKSKEKTLVYLNYPFFQTSYFVYTKGQRFTDVFKKSAYMTDNYECYPVTTFSDYDQITKQLGIPLDFKSQNSERMMKTRAQIGDKKQISPCGLKAALYDKIGTLTLKYDDSTKEIVLDTTDLVHDMYKKHAVSDPEDYIDVTDPKFLSWYFPQVPGFGTKLFLGTATQGLSGKVRFLFDKRGVFFEPTQTPEIILIVRGSKLSETFSNQTFGWINIGVGVFSIFGFWLFTYLQSKKAQI